MGYQLVLVPRLSLDAFAAMTGLHPELVRRLIVLGIVEPTRDANGQWCFDRSQVRAVARMQRLRSSFALNYSALGLVMDLLDRIDALESERRTERTSQPS